jgi:hypothetical protein
MSVAPVLGVLLVLFSISVGLSIGEEREHRRGRISDHGASQCTSDAVNRAVKSDRN